MPKALTTNTVKVKERSQKDVKLTMVTTGKVKPKVFMSKGKRKGKRNGDLITTGNIGTFQAKRKIQVPKEQAAAKIRKDKLDSEKKALVEKK